MTWWVYCYCGSIALLVLSWPFVMYCESKRRSARDYKSFERWVEAESFFYTAFFCGMGLFFLTSALLMCRDIISKT